MWEMIMPHVLHPLKPTSSLSHSPKKPTTWFVLLTSDSWRKLILQGFYLDERKWSFVLGVYVKRVKKKIDLEAEYDKVLQEKKLFFPSNVLIKDLQCVYTFLFVIVDEFVNYFMLGIHYSGVFTKPTGRKYVDDIIPYIDFIDTNLFSSTRPWLHG